MLLLPSLILLPILTFLLQKALKEYRKYFVLRSLPGPPRSSLVAGNLDKFFDPKESARWHQHLTEKYGSAVRLTGPLGEPQVFLSDPKGLETVLLREGDAFEKPEQLYSSIHMGLFGEGSGSVRGVQHRKQRRRVGPALTPSASKALTPKFSEIADQLRRVFRKQTQSGNGKAEIDVRRWLGLAALEITVQSLGATFDLLDDEKEPHPYNKAALPPLLIMLFHPFTRIGTPAIRQFLSSLIPLQTVSELKGVLRILDKTGNEIYRNAQEAMQADKVSWNLEFEKNPSIIASLLSENKQRSETERLSHDEIVGMINSLIFAAHDTSANAMTRCLDVLAKRIDIQQQLREEIREVFDGDRILDLDKILELPTLDAFIKEVLRMYAPLLSMPRVARKDTTVPLLHPVLAIDGKTLITEIHVKAGTTIQVAMSESNLNTKTWGPDAREFKIERWLEPLPNTVTSAGIPGIFSNLCVYLCFFQTPIIKLTLCLEG
ncbi:cytochrome P450 [Schizopora paradoxa]|uniref:Cytochrome P450 n=1 Tax=Schizopora paradoxa TaxID=27342 RepID=A0A0H2SIH2_9AGAM|nr:cytochrome P450 [Schizopora paradoxa]